MSVGGVSARPSLRLVDDSGAAEPDAVVLDQLRRGDTDAYAVLYGRHARAARRLAGSLLGNATDVDDVVSDVFAAAFRAIRGGKGPADDFGPYVLRSVRRECARSWRKRARRCEWPTDDVDVAADEHHGLEERAVLQQAFNALPAHLRQVLWLTEVERLSHTEVADRTASTSQAVAALAMRARKALAEEYLAAHVAPTTPPECARVRRSLAGTVRGTASRRQQRRVAAHLAGCRECAQAERQLRLVNRRLRTLAPPALVGAMMVPRFVSLGLRGRLAAWLLGPAAAPLTAVTGLLATGIALPAATTQAERPAVVATAELGETAHEGASQRNTAGAAGADGVAAGSAAGSSSGGEPIAVDAMPSGSAAATPGARVPSTLVPRAAAPTSTLPSATTPTTAGGGASSPDVGLDTGIRDVGTGLGVGADLGTGKADVGLDVGGVPLPEASLQAEVTVPPAVGSLPIVSDVLPPSDEPVLEAGIETGDDSLEVDLGVDAPVEEVTEVVEPVTDAVGGLLGAP